MSASNVSTLFKLRRFVERLSDIADIQFADDPGLPKLPMDPRDKSLSRRTTHHLLLVASIDQRSLVGVAENARKLLWVRKNRSQVSLESWTETRGSVAPVNRALINIQLTIVKAELQEILDTFRAINPEYRLETLHKLQRLIPTAQALVEETGDTGLREMVALIAEQVEI